MFVVFVPCSSLRVYDKFGMIPFLAAFVHHLSCPVSTDIPSPRWLHCFAAVFVASPLPISRACTATQTPSVYQSVGCHPRFPRGTVSPHLLNHLSLTSNYLLCKASVKSITFDHQLHWPRRYVVETNQGILHRPLVYWRYKQIYKLARSRCQPYGGEGLWWNNTVNTVVVEWGGYPLTMHWWTHGSLGTMNHQFSTHAAQLFIYILKIRLLPSASGAFSASPDPGSKVYTLMPLGRIDFSQHSYDLFDVFATSSYHRVFFLMKVPITINHMQFGRRRLAHTIMLKSAGSYLGLL